MHDVAIAIIFFLLGAAVGSFTNVLIWRLPRGESILFPGSHCPKCGAKIKFYDNIPIVSYIVLG
ncbi:MAG TPA: prepilin peptidase, partial [candidate division Zixibacteria bacterium]|nr:prepilin peptidase [candidate division Zixibacteria bacterium]